ncbi:MAG TPA: PPC domain-containing DNA-binding protein [bacterium]|nr:PPC domain-containing DNA-binding protein [bacterium]
MDAQRFGRCRVMRLDPGDEIMATLLDFATHEGLGGATVHGIGAFSRVGLRYFDIKEKRYKTRTLDEQVEVVSLLGSIGLDRNGPVIHIHASVSDAQTCTHSGHLSEGIVRPTLELFLTMLDGELRRKKDPDTGLELLDLPRPAVR